MAIPVNAYEQLAGQMLKIYEEAELVMIGRVAKRLAKGVSSPGWTEKKYSEASDMRKHLQAVTDSLKKKRLQIAEKSIGIAFDGASTWAFADAHEFAKSIGTERINPNSAKVAEILNDLNMRMDAADRLILRRTSDVYADVVGEAAALQATGTITTREAVRRALNSFADRGISSFVDAAGRRWDMSTYAEMALLTAIERATIEGYAQTMAGYGYDLAVISSHSGACPICAAWQGVIVSVSGQDKKYLSLDSAREAGVFHPRCLHHLSIYREGYTRGETRSKPRKVEKPSTAYTARSLQRHCERQIRRYKRRQAAATTPVDERIAKAYVNKWQQEVRDVIANAPTTLLRQYYREGGTVKLSDAAKGIPALRIYPSGRVLQRIQRLAGHNPPKPIGQTPYAAFIKSGSGETDTLYLYDGEGNVIMHIDAGHHGNPKEHTYEDEQGNVTHAHYHLAKWDEEGNFKGFVEARHAKAVTDAMKKDFPEFLK